MMSLGMKSENLWAPWRMVYLGDLEHRRDGVEPSDADPGGFLASYWSNPDDDESNHVVHRDEHGMILLNRYPYANGHLLVALGDGRPRLADYALPQRAAFWALVGLSMELVSIAFHPQGLNMGINEGRAAGAGLPGHLHAHVVPRWNGDTNFISVVGGVRVIPDALEATARRYMDVRADAIRSLEGARP